MHITLGSLFRLCLVLWVDVVELARLERHARQPTLIRVGHRRQPAQPPARGGPRLGTLEREPRRGRPGRNPRSPFSLGVLMPVHQADCKSAGYAYVGSNPTRPIISI